jgi:hypothetical protein
MRNLFVLLAVLVPVTPVMADIGPPVDVATRARGASRVVVGRVIDVQSTFATTRFGDQIIVSRVAVDVEETLKGAHQQVVTVTLEGGTVGELTLEVSDMPALRAGERAVLFLDTGQGGEHVPHRRGLGVLTLDASNRVAGTAVSLTQIRQTVREAAAQGRGGR